MAQAERPPLVKIVTAPPVQTSATKAVFRIKRMKATRTVCRLDKRHYRRCGVRVKYAGVKPGHHIFRVRARRRGRTSVVRRRWTVTRSVSSQLPEGGTMLFDDEFDGSELDTSKWNPYNSPGHAGHGLRRPSAISVSGGNLVMTAQMVDGQLESGGMSNKLNHTYGRYEFRVRTESDPTGTMSGVVLTWPQHQWSPEFTENDIYETGMSVDRKPFRSFIHFGTSNSQRYFEHQVDATEWHTMVMDWRPDFLKIYRDGKLVWTLTDRDVVPDVMHHVSIQLDARADNTLAAPVRMYVDYLRIYE